MLAGKIQRSAASAPRIATPDRKPKLEMLCHEAVPADRVNLPVDALSDVLALLPLADGITESRQAVRSTTGRTDDGLSELFLDQSGYVPLLAVESGSSALPRSPSTSRLPKRIPYDRVNRTSMIFVPQKDNPRRSPRELSAATRPALYGTRPSARYLHQAVWVCR